MWLLPSFSSSLIQRHTNRISRSMTSATGKPFQRNLSLTIREDSRKWFELSGSMKAPSQSLPWQVRIIESLQRALIFSGVADAREQLTRRFMLIDAVARIGFNATIIFSGKIYVPYIGKGQTTFYETPGMPESSFSMDVSHAIDDDEDDLDSNDIAPKSINPPGGLRGYT